MSREECIVLTEADNEDIDNELLHINATDLALDDEYVKIKAEWEMLMAGVL
jgi:hypothetical protein